MTRQEAAVLRDRVARVRLGVDVALLGEARDAREEAGRSALAAMHEAERRATVRRVKGAELLNVAHGSAWPADCRAPKGQDAAQAPCEDGPAREGETSAPLIFPRPAVLRDEESTGRALLELACEDEVSARIVSALPPFDLVSGDVDLVGHARGIVEMVRGFRARSGAA